MADRDQSTTRTGVPTAAFDSTQRSPLPTNSHDSAASSPEVSAAPTLPSITLPKGGGAVRGIDEKLTVGLATGAATLSVPLPTTPAREGFSPALALGYDSGSGNGVFGLGWQLGVASITRKTSRGLPRYFDAEDSDVFVLSDAEDLVPLAAAPQPDPTGHFEVRRYQPRVESAFTRIERWTEIATGDVHWRTISRANVTSLFGQTAATRIVDPADQSHVFMWLLALSYDDRGNAIAYEYKAEDGTQVPQTLAEHGRTSTASKHLKRIHYGNDTPYLPAKDPAPPADWRFHVVLDYGDHDPLAPELAESRPWTCRPGSYSTYRSGFELRTHRLCHRVLLFHSFPEHLGHPDVLVNSTDLTYSTDAPGDPALPSFAQITTITQNGYIRDSASGAYRKKSRPPLNLEYSRVAISDAVAVADADALANLPAGVDGRRWRWADLDGEGTQGVLVEGDGSWYYKRNVSAYAPPGAHAGVRFEPLALIAHKPVAPNPSTTAQLVDLHGDGDLCVVDMAPPTAGYSKREGDSWAPFRPFPTAAVIDWASPDVRTLDLDGDGLGDVLLTEDDAFTWYRWLAEDGFAPGERVSNPYDEERGPHVVLAEGDSSIFLADMSGDGLSDLVRIRNGEICYWPNLGYGRFGAKVAMEGAPWFDGADAFDADRIRLADIDGSGTTDVVYLGASGAQLWFNQSGNSFTAPTALRSLPRFDSVDRIDALDLLGAGTTCLVWSSPLPGESGRQLRYVDLMGGVKPHLLTRTVNNVGAETTLTYATSTRFYLEDRLENRPWITRLAFPVHVVEREELFDRVTGTRLVRTYRYHHGYFDGVEREFRGFGMVEQTDAETVPSPSGTGTFTTTPSIAGSDFALAPVRTCTWFHTGAYVGGADIAARLATEYWRADAQATPLGETLFSGLAAPEERREACRALRGRTLRTEVYADDGSGVVARNPYVATQHRYQVRLLQAPTETSYGSVYACDCETVSYHYERNAADPRVMHELVLEVDPYGAVTKSASVAYARRGVAAVPEQGRALLTYVEHDVANITAQPHAYRLGLPVESRTYELTGLGNPNDTSRFTPELMLPQITGAASIAYDVAAGAGAARRLVSRERVVYRADDLSAALPLGQVGPLALVDCAYTLAMTAPMAASVYDPKIAGSTAIATGHGGYVDLDGDASWWAPTPRLFYSPDPAHPDAAFARTHFYLPQGNVDPFGNITRVGWEHDLTLVHATDPVGNETSAQINYRVVQPWLLTDTNGNRTGVRFDELGTVIASALMGKALAGGASEADHLDTTTAESAAADDPTTTFDYDLDVYRAWASNPASDPAKPAPVFAHSRTRVRHKDAATPWLESYVYCDGMGRTVLTKAQAEPGGAAVVAADGSVSFQHSNTRWLGSGRVVLDNKGNPVKAYEPFFASDSAYTAEPSLVQWGVTSITRYDPLGRAVRVDKPNGTYTAVEFDAWRSLTSDDNDTVLDSAWYSARSGGGLGAAQQDAATKAAAHAGTPLVADLDTLGRTVRSIADGEHGQFVTSRVLDILGRVVATVDALNRNVITAEYAIGGTAVLTASIDAGQRWLLADATGKPLRQWDSRDAAVRHTYDAARRPLGEYVSSGGGAERLAESLTYGEGQPHDAQNNLRGAVYEARDGAGLASTPLRDFKGNLLTTQRQLLPDPRADVNWAVAHVDPDMFVTTTSYDALNRVVTATTPDGSVTARTYNERSLLGGVTVAPSGAAPVSYVRAITYDARGQRQEIDYANGAVTTYTYDPETFHLTHLVTARPAGGSPVQDLTYTYDAVGNITRVVDAAQSTIFFANQLVAPIGDYTYDTIYRLHIATGREHVAAGADATTWGDSDRRAVPLPSDTQAMRNYSETFSYDLVGNLKTVVHAATNGGWTRTYAYDEPNVPAQTNRLSSCTVGASVEHFGSDANGNMTAMAPLAMLGWDYQNRLETTARQVVAAGDPQATWYRYDSGGMRVRKATVAAHGAVQHERIYIGAYELYREYAPNGTVSLERQTVVVSDVDRHVALLETTTVDRATAAVPSTTTRYQFANHLGSASLELDEHSAVITYEEYYPYGATSFQAGRSAAEVSLKRYRYIGRERDSESSLSYHGARYYAPWLGRWTSCDPAGLADGPSAYVYCRDNPMILHDPGGKQGTPATADTSEVTVSRRDDSDPNVPVGQRPFVQWIPPPPSAFGTPNTVFGNVTQGLGDAGQRGGALTLHRGVVPGGPERSFPLVDVEANAVLSRTWASGSSADAFAAQVSARAAPFRWVPDLTLGGFVGGGPSGAIGAPSTETFTAGATAQYGVTLSDKFAVGGFVQYAAAGASGSPTTHTGTLTPILQWNPNDNAHVSVNLTGSRGTGGSFLNQANYGAFWNYGAVVGAQLWSHLIVEGGVTRTEATRLPDSPTGPTGETRAIGGVGYAGSLDAEHGGPVSYSAVVNVFHGFPTGATGGTSSVEATTVLLTLTFALRVPLFSQPTPPPPTN